MLVARTLPDATRLTRVHWRLLLLLFLSVFINYIDRSNLAIAAPLLKDEFGFSASQLGFLLSAFFWTYASFQLVSGWLVDRYDACWVMAAGFFLWSSATAATGLLHGFAAFVAIRMLLGIGESVAYPSYSKIVSQHFPEDRRGLANSIIQGGLLFGPACGMLFGGMLVASVGWRPFFVGLGLLCLLWLVPWMKWKPAPVVRNAVGAPFPAGESATEDTRVSTSQVLGQRSAWGTFLGLFCGNYLNYFMLTWLPYYLVRERHFSMRQMALIGGAAYGCAAVSALLAGSLADLWIRHGTTPTVARKAFTVSGLVGASVILIACIFARPTLGVALVIVLTCCFGVAGSNLWAISQTLAGPRVVGRWVGVQNFIGNLAGVVAPAITGLLIDRTGHFGWALATASAFLVIGAASYLFVVGRVEPIDWTARETSRSAPAASSESAAA